MLVLHGGLGIDHTYLRPGLDPLRDRLSLIYIDLRGNGRSARPHTIGEWNSLTFERWAEDVELVRQSLGAEKLFVFGHSIGGAIAQEYAFRYPRRVAGLVLCASYVAFDYAETAVALAMQRAQPEQREMLIRALSGPIESDELLAEMHAALTPLYFHRPDHPAIATAFANVLFSAPAFNQSFRNCLPHFVASHRLPHLNIPMLVIAGDDDWIAPPRFTAERFARLVPSAKTIVLENSGHYPFLEQPAPFRAALESWLDAVE